MPINNDFSKSIKRIEKNIETFQIDPIYEINIQFTHYIIYWIHICYKCWQISCGQIKIIIT